MEGSRNKLFTVMQEIQADMGDVQEKQSVDLGTMRREMKIMEVISKMLTEANKINVEIKRTMERVENKDSFTFMFVDVVKQSERLSRDLYTPSLYGSTIYCEVPGSSLRTLEGTIILLHLINSKDPKDTGGSGFMMDGISEGLNANNTK